MAGIQAAAEGLSCSGEGKGSSPAGKASTQVASVDAVGRQLLCVRGPVIANGHRQLSPRTLLLHRLQAGSLIFPFTSGEAVPRRLWGRREPTKGRQFWGRCRRGRPRRERPAAGRARGGHTLKLPARGRKSEGESHSAGGRRWAADPH